MSPWPHGHPSPHHFRFQEEQASTSMAKCRELQHELDNVEGRADAAESTLSRIRAETRGRISGLLTTSTPVVSTHATSVLSHDGRSYPGRSQVRGPRPPNSAYNTSYCTAHGVLYDPFELHCTDIDLALFQAPTEVISPLTRRTLTTVLPKRPQTTTITKSRLSSFR